MENSIKLHTLHNHVRYAKLTPDNKQAKMSIHHRNANI